MDALCPALDRKAFQWVACEALERRHGIGKGALIVLDVVPEPGALMLVGANQQGENGWTKITDVNTRLIMATSATYEMRRRWLKGIIPELPIVSQPEPDKVYLESWDGSTSPNGLWESLQAINASFKMPANTPFYEGMVAKKLDAPYNIQLRSPDETSTAYVKFRWKF